VSTFVKLTFTYHVYTLSDSWSIQSLYLTNQPTPHSQTGINGWQYL